MYHSRHTIQGAIEPRTSINRRRRSSCRGRVRAKERQTDKQIDALCSETVACLHVSACTGRRCVRELVTREANVHREHTYASGWLSSYNGYASGEAGSIHSCSARTSGLPFTISHLPFTILLERACFNHCNPLALSLSLSLFLSRSPFLFAGSQR